MNGKFFCRHNWMMSENYLVPDNEPVSRICLKCEKVQMNSGYGWWSYEHKIYEDRLRFQWKTKLETRQIGIYD